MRTDQSVDDSKAKFEIGGGEGKERWCLPSRLLTLVQGPLIGTVICL